MTPENLALWRQQHNVSQQELANMLHVARLTIIRWERGTHPIPLHTYAKLMTLQTTGAVDKSQPPQPAPQLVIPDTATLRPDLALYEPVGSIMKARWIQGPEHPCRLLGVPHPAPWEILTSENYQQALARHRGNAFKRTSDLPTGSPVEHKTLNLPSRASKP